MHPALILPNIHIFKTMRNKGDGAYSEYRVKPEFCTLVCSVYTSTLPTETEHVSLEMLIGWLHVWLGFNGILSMQVAAISCLKKFTVC